MGLVHSNFSGWLHNTIFSARVRFGRSRSLILVQIESACVTCY